MGPSWAELQSADHLGQVRAFTDFAIASSRSKWSLGYYCHTMSESRVVPRLGNDQAIIIWDVETKQEIFNLLVKHTGQMWLVCFPNGKRLA
jgi:hypothetical protein